MQHIGYDISVWNRWFIISVQINDFLTLDKENLVLVEYYADILGAILPSIADKEPKIRQVNQVFCFIELLTVIYTVVLIISLSRCICVFTIFCIRSGCWWNQWEASFCMCRFIKKTFRWISFRFCTQCCKEVHFSSFGNVYLLTASRFIYVQP